MPCSVSHARTPTGGPAVEPPGDPHSSLVPDALPSHHPPCPSMFPSCCAGARTRLRPPPRHRGSHRLPSAMCHSRCLCAEQRHRFEVLTQPKSNPNKGPNKSKAEASRRRIAEQKKAWLARSRFMGCSPVIATAGACMGHGAAPARGGTHQACQAAHELLVRLIIFALYNICEHPQAST